MLSFIAQILGSLMKFIYDSLVNNFTEPSNKFLCYFNYFNDSFGIINYYTNDYESTKTSSKKWRDSAKS